jgi:hypothetical protein
MAFLRSEKKKSGTYLRIMQSYREGGKARQRTLYSLGKLEDYTADQLENIARKLMELAGRDLSELVGGTFQEQGRYNYGYAQVLHELWSVFGLDVLMNRIKRSSRVSIDIERVLILMIAERMNDPCSKRGVYFHQSDYLGFGEEIPLHHLYRTLDVLSDREEQIKQYLFSRKRSLFSSVLDVVFYDVTTLYFDSQVEQEDALRQKGYSKDGKAHKTQIVLGLLVDKARNPITYQIYQGNTYEGATMMDALRKMKKHFTIDQVVVVADSAMIDKNNRDFMVDRGIDYIIGDSIKTLGKAITEKLIDKDNHQAIDGATAQSFTYTEQMHKGRRIICTWSTKRARKDAHQRQVLIDKAQKWLDNPAKYNQVTKRGAGRFITTSGDGQPIELNTAKMEADARYDGFKAIATTTDLTVAEVLAKYHDLFEVEHSFRALKSQLEIRPLFHWTDKRIKGHVCMCFMAYTFINHLRNTTAMQYDDIIRTIDRMQVSDVLDPQTGKRFYMRAKVCEQQQLISTKLGLRVLNDTMPQSTINQVFTKKV